MISLPVKLALGALLTVVLAAAALYVLQVGPFHRPSVAAKAIPKVQAAVAKTQTAVGTEVVKADTKTKAALVVAERKGEVHVAKIRSAPAGLGDGEFYRGVCDTQFYAGSADCSGVSRKP